ncbi:DUF7091 family protein [Haloarchaeobius amylolyticus]|uniref:DUF7091 family protein n=1 Tax=Haloarchaeobius amylolyticus TaxID=1198296 RepID=UPI00226DDEAF
MSDEDDDPVGRFIRKTFRSAGRQYAKTRENFTTGRQVSKLPHDEYGRARLVCRRYAEKRAVLLSDAGVPECFDPENPDCQGCLEDIQEGQIETW